MTEETLGQGVCPYCGVYVEFRQLGSVTLERQGTAYALRCPNTRCKRCLVALEDGGGWRRYPPAQPKDIPGVPPNVMDAYREAVIALEAGAPHAAACMVRRTVASAATEQGIPDEEGGQRLGLQTRIDGLKDKLLPATYGAAKAARVLGDAGAHEEAEERLGDVDAETVRKTISVVRQFLANLYELPKEIEELE